MTACDGAADGSGKGPRQSGRGSGYHWKSANAAPILPVRVILVLLLWVHFNILRKHELAWLGGLSLSMSWVALLFPSKSGFVAKILGTLNAIGFYLPIGISALQEQALKRACYTILGSVLIAIMAVRT